MACSVAQSGAASEPRKPSLAAALSVNVSVAAFFLFCSDTALAANTDLQPQMVTALAEEVCAAYPARPDPTQPSAALK